jgi:hypothetical protein
VKNVWRKWSYEIPLALGDALWDVLVVQFAAFLDRLTLRKVIESVAIALLVVAFAQTLPIDLAFLFAGDLLMYLEFIVAIRLATAWLHVRQVVNFAMRTARLAIRAIHAAVRLPILALNRLRERRTAQLPAKPGRHSDNADDDRDFGITWGALAPA